MSRVLLVRRGGAGTSSGSSTKEEEGTFDTSDSEKSRLKNAKGGGGIAARSSMGLWIFLASIILLMGVIAVQFGDVVVVSGGSPPLNGTSGRQPHPRLVQTSNQPSSLSMLDVAQTYQNCSNVLSSFVHSRPSLPPRPPSEWRKPLWVPSLMASGSASPSRKGDIVKEWIDGTLLTCK
jgi:hypothetical protein